MEVSTTGQSGRAGQSTVDDRGRIAELEEKVAQLETALQSRIVIEQAKGILAERFGLDVEDAFALMRRAARSNGLRIRVLAKEVVSGRETPAPIAKVARTWTPRENAESG